jgi:hypothetical protein
MGRPFQGPYGARLVLKNTVGTVVNSRRRAAGTMPEIKSGREVGLHPVWLVMSGTPTYDPRKRYLACGG